MKNKYYEICWIEDIELSQAIDLFEQGETVKIDCGYNDGLVSTERSRKLLADSDKEAIEKAKKDKDLPEIFSLIRVDTKTILTEED